MEILIYIGAIAFLIWIIPLAIKGFTMSSDSVPVQSSNELPRFNEIQSQIPFKEGERLLESENYKGAIEQYDKAISQFQRGI